MLLLLLFFCKADDHRIYLYMSYEEVIQWNSAFSWLQEGDSDQRSRS